MITVTFDGVEYTKASQVAKEFGYTSDYIGQLCRAKKVNARLVGRSWFVNIPSLKAHREGRYAAMKTKSVETTSEQDAPESVPITKKEKADIPSKKYLRRVPAPDRRLKKVVERTDNVSGVTRQVSVSYEADDNSLLPKMTTAPKVTLLKVDIADSERLKVKSESRKKSKLVPEPLPEVSLSGKLSVSEIPDGEYTNDLPEAEEAATEEKSDKRDNDKNKVKIKKVTKEAELKKESTDKPEVKDEKDEAVLVEVNKPPVTQSKKATAATTQVPKKAIKTPVTAKNRPNMVNIRPVDETAVEEIAVAKEIAVRDINTSAAPSPIQIHVPAIAVVLGVVVGSLILSAEQVGFVTAQVTDFDIEFVWSNIRNFASVLFTGR